MRARIEEDKHSGFLLTEQHLRRLVQTCSDECAKIGPIAEELYVARLGDGSEILTRDIEDIVTLDNGGARAISSLELEWKMPRPTGEVTPVGRTDDPDSDDGGLLGRIRVRFSRPPLSKRFDSPIGFEVFGDERDWVFVTASTIGDRLTQAQRFAPRSASYDVLRQRVFWMIPLLASLILFTMLMSALAFSGIQDERMRRLDDLEAAWRRGEIVEPVEITIHVARTEIAPAIDFTSTALVLLISFAPVAIYGIYRLWFHWFPAHIFAWGDQGGLAARAESRKRALVWTVGVGFVVAVAATLVATLLL